MQVNTGDIQRILQAGGNCQRDIFTALNDRVTLMIEIGTREGDRVAPKGKGRDWRRGDIDGVVLSKSHKGRRRDAFTGEIWSEARHAVFIHDGFTPHMPPEYAWTGNPKLSFPARRKVLQAGTPEAPRPWFDKIEDRLVDQDIKNREALTQKLLATWASGGGGGFGGARATTFFSGIGATPADFGH
jgi:hypothetical protein